MAIYFAIKDCERGPTLYVDLPEAKEILDSMAQNRDEHDNERKYSFEAIEMTEKEFKGLPDFDGF